MQDILLGLGKLALGLAALASAFAGVKFITRMDRGVHHGFAPIENSRKFPARVLTLFLKYPLVGFFTLAILVFLGWYLWIALTY